jgi:hypothetical protein
LGLPAFAQVTGGHETVQDAIRFERQKDAAAARQARMEAGREANSSADRTDTSGTNAHKSSKARKGSAARSKTTSKPQQ